MSRPRWSEPSQYWALGGASVAAALVAIGSWVAITSADTATTTMTSMMKPPAAPRGFFRQKRTSADPSPAEAGRAAAGAATAAVPASAIAYPRVEDAVEHVHHQVRHDDDDRGEHHEVLHDRVIAPEDGLDEEPGDPGQVEHGLGDHEPADEEGELDADDGDDGEDRVLQGVPPDH